MAMGGFDTPVVSMEGLLQDPVDSAPRCCSRRRAHASNFVNFENLDQASGNLSYGGPETMDDSIRVLKIMMHKRPSCNAHPSWSAKR
jgi:hypothetical protein